MGNRGRMRALCGDTMMAEIYANFPELSKEELVEAAYEMTGGNLADLTIEQLAKLFTVATHVFDLCLNEIERRGHLALAPDGSPIIPYCSEYTVETVLTRECN